MAKKLRLEEAQKLKAESLKKEFAVFGHFYDRKFKNEVIPCREILEIISLGNVPHDFQGLPLAQAELIVVMMNPGSSKPASKSYIPIAISRPSDITKKRYIVAAKPDNAQYQIMRIMLINGWSHARILNLSDLRQPKSAVFMKTWPTLSESHSIFSKPRQNSLYQLIGEPEQVLLAWSQEESLRPLAEMAGSAVDSFNTIGLSRGENLYAYPSPMLQKHKEAWLENIMALMNDKYNE